MKKGLAVFSGSAVVHKLMQDGTVVLGTAANPAAVTVSGNVNVTGQMTASANSVLVGNIGGEFTNTTLGGILVELKNAAATGTGTLSSSLKSYIDAQDQAEASARSSADSALQTSLSNASSSLKTYIDGIDTAQTSANAALSSSLKTYIDAADAVLQSAIDAEKARIDTILSGADINLDQFVEVVQFVNDLSGANYEALMDAVTDINNSIDAVSGALAQEITDRETAVAGVQSNLDSLSGSVSSSLAAEVTARIADVDAEEARAIAAETVLDARLDDHDVIFSVKKDVAYNDNPLVYADAASGTIDQRSGSHDIRDGWAFKNSVAGQKINWYFMNGSPVDSLADNVTVSQMTGAFAVVTMDSTTSKPFFAMYTVPQGTGDVIPGFARSRIVYSNTSTPVTAGKKYLVHFGADPKVHPELERIPLTISAGSSGGPQLTSERVLTIALGTNSAAAVNTVNFVAESVGFMSSVVNREIALKIRPATKSDLDTEIAARIAGDAAVQSNLNSVSGSLKAAIDAIQLGASGDTTALSSSLKSYVDGLDAAQTAANSGLSSSLKTYIDAQDVADAAAWAAADASLSGTLSSALAAEISRATTAEAGLQTSINTEKARIDAILSGSTADLDQFKEVVDFINSISGTNATALANSISNVSSSLSSALGAEISRATTAEAALQTAISTAAFTVNEMPVSASGGAFTIAAGLSNNLSVTSGSGVVTVDLNSSVTLAGTLTANTLTASAGLSVVGGASVAGGLTVSSGDVVVSHGVSKTILDSSADSVRLTALSDATNLAAGEFDGMSFYLKGAAVGAFARPNCWYFCQDGEWFDAPFYAGE